MGGLNTFNFYFSDLVNNNFQKKREKFLMVGVLDLSKAQLVSLIRAGKEAQIQLLGNRIYAGNGIYAEIIANGFSQNNHILCCLCKSVLQTGSSNKSNLSRHRSNHIMKGDTTNPEIIKALINDFNKNHSKF